MLPFRGGTEQVTARIPAVRRAWQEAKAVGWALAWVTLLLLAGAADTLPHVLPVAPTRSLGVTMPRGKRTVILVRRWDEQASGGVRP